MSTDKHQILEPITAISRLITLAFKPKGTKIAIRNHNIVLCEPKNNNTASYYNLLVPQGIDRYWNGDSREDIWIINHVLCNFIDWYINPYKNSDIDSDLDIYRGLLNMANYLRVGLKELQNTYKSGTAVGTIQYYIIVLTAVIEGRFRQDMLYTPSSTGRESFLDTDEIDGSNLIYSTIFDVEKFKHFWSKEELKSLCGQFDTCFKPADEPNIVVFRDDTADELDMIDCEHIIDDNNSDGYGGLTDDVVEYNGSKRNTYKSDKNSSQLQHQQQHQQQHQYLEIPLPTPKSQSNVIVKSQLIGIYNILSLMDNRFTTMLSHSVKGTH